MPDSTRPFDCLDCSVDTNAINEYYMVKQAVWKQATGDQPNGMLCIRCLEKRIGRRLQPSDFTEHMGQQQLELYGRCVSARLASRLKGDT